VGQAFVEAHHHGGPLPAGQLGPAVHHGFAVGMAGGVIRGPRVVVVPARGPAGAVAGGAPPPGIYYGQPAGGRASLRPPGRSGPTSDTRGPARRPRCPRRGGYPRSAPSRSAAAVPAAAPRSRRTTCGRRKSSRPSTQQTRNLLNQCAAVSDQRGMTVVASNQV